MCVDHWAALVVDGGSYEVFHLRGKPGTVMEDGTWTEDGKGTPGTPTLPYPLRGRNTIRTRRPCLPMIPLVTQGHAFR